MSQTGEALPGCSDSRRYGTVMLVKWICCGLNWVPAGSHRLNKPHSLQVRMEIKNMGLKVRTQGGEVLGRPGTWFLKPGFLKTIN